LNALRTEERWGPLRSGPEPGDEESDTTVGADSSSVPAPDAAPAGAGEGDLPQ
jgi:hypothetical protein